VRKGLIMTTNYPDVPGAQLLGCDHDGDHVEGYLESLGFDEIVRLQGREPTWKAIVDQLTWHVSQLTGKDLLVVHYSGHGTQGSIALTPGAPAVKHEGLVPYDFRQRGILWDATVRDILGRAHPHARVVVILDSCFAGGMYRFAGPLFDAYRMPRYLPPDVWLRAVDVQAEVEQADEAELLVAPDLARQFVLEQIERVAGQQVDKAYPVVLLAASKPDQVAWCAEKDGEAVGAFTTALLAAARGQRPDGTVTTPPRTYLELMYGSAHRQGVTTIRADRPGWLPSPDANQDPTLHGSPGRVRWELFAA
jgi:hypothetical protein